MQMCSQEVLGLTDVENTPALFHEDFMNQLQRLEDGTYSTRLPWKLDHTPLPSNKDLTMSRLKSTTRKLEKMQRLEEYHMVMEQQLEEGILEVAPEIPTGEVIHYIPHQPVIREQAETTKMRIVYDCSAKTDLEVPSLNDCLEVGPPLQPMIFDILLRNRLKFLCITGDIQKAFLQIKVNPEDRDALRLLWYENLDSRSVVHYRFTRVIFGSGPSPYILCATLQKHVSQYADKYPRTTDELLKNTYVDDVQSGGEQHKELLAFKEESTRIMEEGGFQLHKWHSNIPELEEPQRNGDAAMVSVTSSTYAKQKVGTDPQETKILGVPWNKTEDKLSIGFMKPLRVASEGPLTKRKMLSAINGVFDLLGIAAPVVITGKILYSETCLRKLKWDEEIPDDIQKPWKKWLKGLEECPQLSIPRSVVNRGVKRIILHGFSDASKKAISVAIYGLAFHTAAPVHQNLLVAKSRIAPKDLSIPRLELIGAHTLSRLMNHVKGVLQGHPIDEYHCWVDSTTVLHWIKGQGTWSQFVRNRTKAIQEKGYLQWHHVPTSDNPSDQGSRGIEPIKMGELWFQGPSWLSSTDKWPQQPEVSETSETARERVKPKFERQLLAKKEQKVPTDTLLHKYASYWKLLRVTAFVRRFIENCRKVKMPKGPLTTEEFQAAENIWIKQAQSSQPLKSDVGLKKDDEGILRCVGRVRGYHPVFLPRESKLASLIVQQVHEQMMHGGVSTTMCRIREKFWIPKLRALTKKVIRNCNICKRYRKKPVSTSCAINSTLPVFRVELSDPFAVTGVDFAGPVHYKIKKSVTAKAYVALFTCASTRAVHLKLCRDLSAIEFQRALKEFVARRGCPQTIVSDNGKTFVTTGKWLSVLKKNHSLANYMGALNIMWKFNLARAPWWGGFFERLVGIMKRSLSKVIGRSLLTYPELEEVLLDCETTMNNRGHCSTKGRSLSNQC